MEAFVGRVGLVGALSAQWRYQFRLHLPRILNSPVAVARCEDFVGTDAVSRQVSGPIVLIFSISRLYLEYLGPQTTILWQQNLLNSPLRLVHLLLHQLIYPFSWRLHAEMDLDSTQSLLFFSLYLFLLNYQISDFCQKGLSQQIFNTVPAQYKNISIDPIFCVVLMNFFETSLDGVWLGIVYFEISTQHLLEFLSLKNSPHPFLFLRVKQQPLTIKEIVLKLTNVEISVGKVSFSIILETIPEIETPLNAFSLERACVIIISFIYFEFEPHSFQMIPVISESYHNPATLFKYFDTIAQLQVEFESVFVSLIHNHMQILVRYLINDIPIRLYNLSYDLSALVEKMVYLHGLVVNQDSIAIGQCLLFIIGNLDDTLPRSHNNLHSSIFEEES